MLSSSDHSEPDFKRRILSVPLLNDHPLPTWLVEKGSLCISYANAAAVKRYAYSNNEFSSLNFLDLFSGSGKEEYSVQLNQKVKEGAWNMTATHTDKYGTAFEVALHGSCVNEQGEEFIMITAVMDHIKELNKNAEMKLSESERFYRALITDALDGMLLLDTEGMISFASPAVKHILGYNVNELQGKSGFEFVHPEDLPHAIDAFQKEVLEEPVVKFITIRLRKKNGDWLWCMVRGHNLLQNPDVKSIAVYFHDDTLRKQGAEALKESEKRFRHLIRDLQTGVLLQDAQGKILMFNNAAHKILSTTEEALKDKIIWKIFTDAITEEGRPLALEERPCLKAIITKKLVTDFVMGVWIPNTNERKWLLISADPILDDHGNILHIVSSFTDITERRRLEKELLTKQLNHQKQLTQATIDGQEKERLEIGKELHDNIGQQLTTIKLFLDLALSTANDTTGEMISMALKGISDVINEVRSMSRTLVPSTLKDLGLIDSVRELTEMIAKTQLLSITLDDYEFDEGQLLDNQKLMLFRIIQEQLNNVVKHAGARHVWVSLKTDDQKITLSIIDDGHGFDPKTIRKGLGFINIDNRAELFGGYTELNTLPGKGCMLKVHIPYKPHPQFLL